MGKEDGRAPREIFQEKKRTYRLSETSDHLENTSSEKFSIIGETGKKR